MTPLEIRRVHEPRVHKITNSVGVYDIYKRLRKSKWYNTNLSISETLFYLIIRQVNKAISNEIALGNSIILPAKMGQIELRKLNVTPSFSNGKLKIPYPIDWKSTLELWSTDAYSYKKKTCLRKLTKSIFFIYYNKHKANYKNKCFYKFSFNRLLKLQLKENIEKGNVDAYTIN